MASNPCADELADLITVIVTPIPQYTNIGSIPPHYYNSIKGRNTSDIYVCSTYQCYNGFNFNFKAQLNLFLYLSVNEHQSALLMNNQDWSKLISTILN